MPVAAQSAAVTKKVLWTGRILTALVVLFLLFDGAIKIMRFSPAVQGMLFLGYRISLVPEVGLILLACTALYLVPRTSVLGALLSTGYLGGATASQFRLSQPLFSHVLFPVYFCVLVWTGLLVREQRLRLLIPLRPLKVASARPPAQDELSMAGEKNPG
jgi:DoxX-like family